MSPDSVTAISFPLAFGAGLLSFLSPCVLPLVPSYLGFLTGMSLDEVEGRRWFAFSHALMFVLGFTVIFLALGATATALGRLLQFQAVWFTRIGGALIVIFGLYLLGAFRWTPLVRERRIQLRDKPVGYLGSALVGVTFGAGWTPCVGPILGSILLFTSTRGSVREGIVLLFVYSLGLAVPFLISALLIDRFLGWFRRFRRFIPIAEKLAGATLVVVGVLLVTGYFSLLASALQSLTPEGLKSRL